MLKKNLTPLYVREKISNFREVWEKILPIQTKSVKSPIPATRSKTSNGHVNHLEGGGGGVREEADLTPLEMSTINKMAGARS